MTEAASIRARWLNLARGIWLLLACGAAHAAEHAALPRVVVLGTGGTIAGAALSSTEFHDYKPGKVGVQALLDAIPGLRTGVLP